ncbi:hypothetical protein [Clostridium sp.]|uniref:hypothetical protein n=1 Tax=Clostridium sp. TaxID=1506 RepID=UPI003D6CBAD2
MIKSFDFLMSALVIFFSLCIISNLIFSNKNTNKRNSKKIYFAISMISFLSFLFFVTIGKFKFKSTLPFLIVGCMSLAEVLKNYQPTAINKKNLEYKKDV